MASILRSNKISNLALRRFPLECILQPIDQHPKIEKAKGQLDISIIPTSLHVIMEKLATTLDVMIQNFQQRLEDDMNNVVITNVVLLPSSLSPLFFPFSFFFLRF